MFSITETINKAKENNRIGAKIIMLEVAYMCLIYMEQYGSKKSGMSLRHIVLDYSAYRNKLIDDDAKYSKFLTGAILDGKIIRRRTDLAEMFLKVKVAEQYNLKKFVK